MPIFFYRIHFCFWFIFHDFILCFDFVYGCSCISVLEFCVLEFSCPRVYLSSRLPFFYRIHSWFWLNFHLFLVLFSFVCGCSCIIVYEFCVLVFTCPLVYLFIVFCFWFIFQLSVLFDFVCGCSCINVFEFWVLVFTCSLVYLSSRLPFLVCLSSLISLCLSFFGIIFPTPCFIYQPVRVLCSAVYLSLRLPIFPSTCSKNREVLDK